MIYPPIDPSDAGFLSVVDGNEIYWETSGNPDGKPALYLHGGPGSGLRSGSYRRHRIVESTSVGVAEAAL